MRKRHPNSVIKAHSLTKGFDIVARDFAQDLTISHFLRSVILFLTSKSEDYETCVSSVMKTFGVGRNKAECLHDR